MLTSCCDTKGLLSPGKRKQSQTWLLLCVEWYFDILQCLFPDLARSQLYESFPTCGGTMSAVNCKRRDYKIWGSCRKELLSCVVFGCHIGLWNHFQSPWHLIINVFTICNFLYTVCIFIFFSKSHIKWIPRKCKENKCVTHNLCIIQISLFVSFFFVFPL